MRCAAMTAALQQLYDGRDHHRRHDHEYDNARDEIGNDGAPQRKATAARLGEQAKDDIPDQSDQAEKRKYGHSQKICQQRKQHRHPQADHGNHIHAPCGLPFPFTLAFGGLVRDEIVETDSEDLRDAFERIELGIPAVGIT